MLLLAVLATAPLRARAELDETVPEIAYSAPPGCPTQREFERRLRARLGAETGTVQISLALRLTLQAGSSQAPRARGELSVISGPRTGARRAVEAASCDEAVDALTLVTALLIEPEPAAQVEHTPQRRSTRPSRAQSPAGDARQSGEAASMGSVASVASDGRSPRALASEPSSSAPATVAGERAAVPAQPREPVRTAASPAPEPLRSTPKPPRPGPTGSAAHFTTEAASPRSLAIELAAAALLATNMLPALRAGFEARGTLALSRSTARALAVELGARGLAPQLERSAAGDARFTFHGGHAALCLERTAAPLRLRVSACALVELARLSAEGRNSDSAKRANVFWSALGPSLRAAGMLTHAWSLQLGAELLFPFARDRFELAERELWRVPSLTFRASLGLAWRFE